MGVLHTAEHLGDAAQGAVPAHVGLGSLAGKPPYGAAGVGVETIRFYEREGLLEKPPRTGAGYRQYPAESVTRVRFIRSAKDLGFTLKEILELLELRVDPDKSCADVRALARAKIVDVDEKMAELARIRSALKRLAKACRGSGPTSECPILDAIEQEECHANR